jgi:hypothetical protein
MCEHRFKEVREFPPEKPRGRCCIIRRATIEVRQDGPHLVALLGQASMMVMHLRQKAVASFDRRRGALQGFDSVACPGVPLLQDVGSQPLRDGVPGTGRLHCLPCGVQSRWTSATTGAPPLVIPIGHGQEALVHPLLPSGRSAEGRPIPGDPLHQTSTRAARAGTCLRTLLMA